MTLVEIARTQIGHQGDGTYYFEALNGKASWPEARLAAFVAWVVREAIEEDERIAVEEKARCREGSAKKWVPHALRRNWTVFGPHDGLRFPAPGDIVIFRDADHMGIVAAFDGIGTITSIEAIEADGYRVSKRAYDRSACKSFIRLPVASEQGARSKERGAK